MFQQIDYILNINFTFAQKEYSYFLCLWLTWINKFNIKSVPSLKLSFIFRELYVRKKRILLTFFYNFLEGILIRIIFSSSSICQITPNNGSRSTQSRASLDIILDCYKFNLLTLLWFAYQLPTYSTRPIIIRIFFRYKSQYNAHKLTFLLIIWQIRFLFSQSNFAYIQLAVQSMLVVCKQWNKNQTIGEFLPGIYQHACPTSFVATADLAVRMHQIIAAWPQEYKSTIMQNQ